MEGKSKRGMWRDGETHFDKELAILRIELLHYGDVVCPTQQGPGKGDALKEEKRVPSTFSLVQPGL
jgi:hypothetical protein